MAKLCFVVHRYAPFPGGSEYYVQAMAEECVRRGHSVTVFAGEHRGDLNGVRVTSDIVPLFNDDFDLIVVHGGDVHVQNFVLERKTEGAIKSPVLYLLILPSNSKTCLEALHSCEYLGYSTVQDVRHLEKHGVFSKGVCVRHSLPNPINKCIGRLGFRAKYGITTPRMFLSSGGYWPNKCMPELAALFSKANIPDTTLVFTGYANREWAPIETQNIRSLFIEDRNEVYDAMREADLYIMHSSSEGFGLVLLEAMVNNCPWAARRIAGAVELRDFGFTYTTDDELVEYMRQPVITFFGRSRFRNNNSLSAFEYVSKHRQIGNTVDDILKVLE